MNNEFIFNFNQKRNQHSHVQIHKAIIDNFSFTYEDPQTGKYHSKTTGVYTLNLQTKEISRTKTKKTGTIFGYFSDEEEVNLSVYENQFCEIVNQDKDINTFYHELQKNKSIIINFVNLLLNRSETRQGVIREIARQVLQRNYGGNLEKVSEFPIVIQPPNIIDQNYGITALVNNTNKNFVIPRNGFYCANYSPNDNIYVLPITPKKALAITNNARLYSHILNIENPVDIYNLNINALLTEMAIDNSILISKNFEELYALKLFLESSEGKEYINVATQTKY